MHACRSTLEDPTDRASDADLLDGLDSSAFLRAGGIGPGDLSFDVATQAELDAEAARRAVADASLAALIDAEALARADAVAALNDENALLRGEIDALRGDVARLQGDVARLQIDVARLFQMLGGGFPR